MEEQIKIIKEYISNKKRITLFLHLNPDGDSIGSSLALQAILEKLGHECTIISPDFMNATINWMPGAEKIIVAKRCMNKTQRIIKDTELFFCADFNQLHRIGMLEKTVRETNSPRIMIDHHINPNQEDFDPIISNKEISSTSELVYRFICEMNLKHLIDKDIATNLYVGIITDTGSLSYSCSHPEVYETIAQLMKYQLDIDKIRTRIYGSYGESRLRILGYALQKMKILPDLRSAYIVLNKSELQNLNYRIGDTEGLANECLTLKDVVFGCLIAEREGGVRLSFRSRGDFDVNILANQYFNGGGHKNASGADSDNSPDDTAIYLENILQQFKNQLLTVEL